MASPGQFVPEYIVTANDMNALPGGVLGYIERTTNSSTFASIELEFSPSLEVVVDIPGGRRIKATAKADFFSTVSGDRVEMRIKHNGSQVQRDVHVNHAEAETAYTSIVVTPSSGSNTFLIAAIRTAGTGSVTLSAAANRPAFLLVEDIGPA